MTTNPREFMEILSLAKTQEDKEQLLGIFLNENKNNEIVETSDHSFHDLEAKVNLLLNKQDEEIEEGDLVTWKKGLKNKKYPQEGQSAKVLKVRKGNSEYSLFNYREDSGSSYFGEPLDLVLALLDEEGDLLVYHYDKRRFRIFEKAKRPVESLPQ